MSKHDTQRDQSERAQRLASLMVESTTEYDWPELPDDIAHTLVAAAVRLLDYLEADAGITRHADVELEPPLRRPALDDTLDDPALAVQLDPTTRAEIARAARTPDHHPLGYLTLIDGDRP